MSDLVPLEGSERTQPSAGTPSGPVDPEERLTVTLMLKRPGRPPEVDDTAPPLQRHYRRCEDLPADDVAANISKVEAFAASHGLDVAEANAAQRRVVIEGTVRSVGAAFGVELRSQTGPEGTYRCRSGPVRVPSEIAPIIRAVLGLDNRPQVEPHGVPAAEDDPLAHSVLASEIARLYNFPSPTSGEPQTVGVLEFGGGYVTEDLKTYFDRLGLPVPSLSDVSVLGAANRPTGERHGPDQEVMLDIEVLGAAAPGVKIVMYFAPNTAQGFVDALTTAVHDNENRPSVISISWGAAELRWTIQAMRAFEDVCLDAAEIGMTVCASTGDEGSAKGVHDGVPHVNFPASCPRVLACGGTRIQAKDGARQSEVVWNDGSGATGGGVSDVFPLPEWQAGTGLSGSGRGVPDVAGHADPTAGYLLRIHGRDVISGGTSAVVPLWAGLIAYMNQELGTRVGFLNALLYQPPARDSFHAVTEGSNDLSGLGVYAAGSGWDPCTGLGTPDGIKLLAALSGSPPRA